MGSRLSLAFGVLASAILLFCVPASYGQGVSSSGTDYWIGFMPNGTPQQYGGYDQTHLFIASSVDNQVQITFAGEVRNVKIPANTVADVTLPDEATTRKQEVPVDGAVHVTSASPITIYGYSVWASPNTIGGSPDGYLALPITSYGKKYYTVNYYASQFGSAPSSGEFLIVAPYDNTQVWITPKGDTRVGSAVSHKAGEKWAVFLNKGQSYLVQSDNSVPAENDLTGSLIESDRPIAVLTGHEITPIVLGDKTSADHLLEMIPPVERWGTQYFDMPMAGRTACGDYIRIISGEDGNQITYNGKGPFYLNAGEYAERELVTDPEVYTSINNKKFVVMQYSYSQGTNGDPGTADPFMILMTAQQQFEKNMVFRTPTPAQSGTFNNYITFICVDSAIRKIKIDGKFLSSYQYVGLASFPATNPTMSAYRVKLPGGPRAYFAEGPAPFGAYQYGFSYYEGYGWPTGMAQRLITPDTLPPLSTILDSSCGTYHVKYFEPRLKTNGFSFDDTHFAYLALVTAAGDPRWPTPSYNYTFSDSSLAVGDSVTVGTLRVIDPSQDAYAAVYAVDLAGNDTVFEYHYYAPKMDVSPQPTYTFSNMLVGTDSCITINVLNKQTSGSLQGGNAVMLGTASGGTFTVTPGALGDIPVNGNFPITVCYHATDTGVVSIDTLTISMGCATKHYALIGNSVTPLIYATDVDFGEVDSGMTRCMPVKVTNRGQYPLTITKQDLVNDPNFSVDPNQAFPITIAPGATVTIQYCFHPQGWGVFDSRVLFSNLNPTQYQHSIKDTSHLSGIAQPAGAKLTTYVKDFGLADCNATPIVHDTLYNDLPNDKEIRDVQIIGPDAQYFKIVSNQPSYPVLLPGNGGSIPYDIQFNPMLNGLDFTPRTATLQVYTADGKSQPAAKLNGVLTTPVVDVSAASVDLGIGKINGQVTSTFTLRNTGNATLTVSSYGLAGADAGAYTLSPAPPYDIAPGGSQIVTVTATGATPRTYIASATVVSGCNSKTVALTAQFSSSSDLVLGTTHPKTYVGGCRMDQQFATVTNTASNDAITLVSASVVAQNGWNDIGDFTIAQPVTMQQINPNGGTAKVAINFTPTAVGPRQAGLLFNLRGKTYDGRDTVWNELVELQGIGVAVQRTFAVGAISTPVTYTKTAGTNFTAPIVIDQPVDVGAPDNGTAEAYGYRFTAAWDRDVVTYQGIDPPNSGIVIAEVGTPSFDAATNIETRIFEAHSTSPITGLTTLANLKLSSRISKLDSTPIVLSDASWLDKDQNQLCYVTDPTLDGKIAIQPECGTATLQDYLKDRTLSGLLGSIAPNPVHGSEATAKFNLATSSTVSIEVLDVMGDVVSRVIDGKSMTAGVHNVTFDTKSLPSGTYFLRMTDGTLTSSKRFMVDR